MRTPQFYSLVFILLVYFCGCGQRGEKGDSKQVCSYSEESDVDEYQLEEIAPIIKDRIDSLVEQRRESEFNSTIFANLRFGSSRREVDNALKNKANSTIRVREGDFDGTLNIRSYDVDYNNNKLTSLVLYADDVDLMRPLGALFSAMYGETKNLEWRYSNCEITIRIETRSRYYSSVDGWMANQPALYYDSYRGIPTNRLTTSPSYLTITFKSYL